MDFSRGDGVNHTFSIPAANWSAGGRLFFAAKPLIDDDNTDANALIQGNWGDEVVTTVPINGISYKQYNCHFPAAATNSLISNGASTASYLGEFQFVGAGLDPVTFPGATDKIDVTVYFDVKRKTTV